MAAHRLDRRRQAVERVADALLGAAQIDQYDAVPHTAASRQPADLLDLRQDHAHRRRQHDDIGLRNAFGQCRAACIDRACSQRLLYRLSPPRDADHPRDAASQRQAQRPTHQAEAGDGDCAVGEFFLEGRLCHGIRVMSVE